MKLILALLTILLAAACNQVPHEPTQVYQEDLSFVPLRHPFASRPKLYVDPDTQLTNWQRQHKKSDWLSTITSQPMARWINDIYAVDRLSEAVADAQKQQALLTIVLYGLPNRHCLNASEIAKLASKNPPQLPAGSATKNDYYYMVDQLALRLRGTKAVIILEPDAVSLDCFVQPTTGWVELLRHAIKTLAPQHYVYVDAGHVEWHTPSEIARRLRLMGVEQAEGISLNVANRQPDANLLAYCRIVSPMIGHRDCVMDTSRNGVTPPGNEWCNPPGQALGVPPGIINNGAHAANLWIKTPGESDGDCGTDAGIVLPTGAAIYPGYFSATQARDMIRATSWVDTATKARLPTQTPVTASTVAVRS